MKDENGLILASKMREIQSRIWNDYVNMYRDIIQEIKKHIEKSPEYTYTYVSKKEIPGPVIIFLTNEGFSVDKISEVELNIRW